MTPSTRTRTRTTTLLIGVKSTALKFGDASLVWLGVFFALALILIDAAVWLAGGSVIAHVGIAGAALHAAWQLARFRCRRFRRDALNFSDPTAYSVSSSPHRFSWIALIT